MSPLQRSSPTTLPKLHPSLAISAFPLQSSYCYLYFFTYSCVDLFRSAASPLEFKFLVNGDSGFSSPVCHVPDASAGLTQPGAEESTGEPGEEGAGRGAGRRGAASQGGRPGTAAERAVQAPPLPAAAQTPRQPRQLGCAGPARTAPPRPAPLPARLLSATSASGGDVVYAEPLRHPAAGRPGP